MRYSYSSISTFSHCPFQWKLRYKDKLKTIPDTAADNALYLGLAIHKGIEERSVEAGVAEYKSHYNVMTDANYNWIIQIEYQLKKLLELIPEGGEHEIEVKTDRFIGYVDYVQGDTIYDWKFSNNVDNYMKSPQLSIYKHFLSVVRPELNINHIKFCFVPKVNIRQKKTENLFEFRKRLQEQLETTEIKIVEVPFDESSISDFEEACKILDTVSEFPKNKTKLCNWCQYQMYCETDGEVDWMIL